MSALPYYHRPAGSQPHMLGGSRTQLTPFQRSLNLGQVRALSQNRVLTNGQQRFPSHATQQYAYPLSRSNTGEALSGNVRDVSKDSEDLLRRKTPGGILNGAYDGSLAGQDDRHVSKHILLPSSPTTDLGSPMSGVFNSVEQALPLRSSDVAHGSRQLGPGPWLNQQQQLFTFTPNTVMSFDSGSQSPTWFNHPFQQSQIDSMLHQIPTHYSQNLFQHPNQFVPSAMQPSPQTPSSPTVSNDQGPFGPYWPNGMYVPYRPAALRDPRYCPQTRSDWFGQIERVPIPPTSGSWDSSGVAPGLGDQPRVFIRNQQPASHIPFDATGFNQSLPQVESSFVPDIRGHGNKTAMQQHAYTKYQSLSPNDYFSAPNAVLHDPSGSIDLAGQPTPSLHNLQGQLPVLDVDSLAAKAQYRDEIFSWAQHVYKELIAFIHHTRKANQQNKHGNSSQQPPRPNIYPKPPRHPSQDSTPTLHRNPYERSFSASQAIDRAKEQHLGRSSQGASMAGHVPGLYHSKSTGWMPGDAQCPNSAYSRRHSFQTPPAFGSSSFQGAIQPLDKYKMLRRTSGISVAHATQNGYNGPISPYASSSTPGTNAVAALEKVSQLCQESNWKWIPGMLLAGCLAYGLDDHQQAHSLYTQILDQDPK